MREIKFRIWDGEKHLYGDDVFTPTYDHFSMNEQLKILNEDFSLEQYTGMKDKNGKEIYEGDIVSCNNESLRYVVFDNGGFLCKLFNSKDLGIFSLNSLIHGIKLVGNIHEKQEKKVNITGEVIHSNEMIKIEFFSDTFKHGTTERIDGYTLTFERLHEILNRYDDYTEEELR